MIPLNNFTHATTRLIQFLVLLQATSRLFVENVPHETYVTLLFSGLDAVKAPCCFTVVIYLSIRCLVEQSWCWWILDLFPCISIFRKKCSRHHPNQKWRFFGAPKSLPNCVGLRYHLESCSRRFCQRCIQSALEAGAQLHSRFSSEDYVREEEGCIAPKQQDMDRFEDQLNESGLELTASIHDKNA